MNIAICDDEKAQRELIDQFVREWADNRNIKINILLFESSEQFWFYWIEDEAIDLILLDIQMGNQNGIELARKIRETDKKMQIVFVTGITEYITQGYDVEALHYLVKPIEKNKLFQCLDKAANKAKNEGRKILLETKQGMVRITIQDIWYLEAFGHQCMIYTKDAAYEIRESIGKLNESNGFEKEAFIMCHRSYLVNLKYVSRIEKDSMILDDGRTVPISRNSYKKVVQKFIDFYKKCEEKSSSRHVIVIDKIV